MRDYNHTELPRLFDLAAQGKLKADYEVYPLAQVEAAWRANTAPGTRIVIRI